MDLKCSLETRLNKEGKPYEVIVIKLTDNVDKLVFLEPAEKELVKLFYINNKPAEETINPFNI